MSIEYFNKILKYNKTDIQFYDGNEYNLTSLIYIPKYNNGRSKIPYKNKFQLEKLIDLNQLVDVHILKTYEDNTHDCLLLVHPSIIHLGYIFGYNLNITKLTQKDNKCIQVSKRQRIFKIQRLFNSIDLFLNDRSDFIKNHKIPEAFIKNKKTPYSEEDFENMFYILENINALFQPTKIKYKDWFLDKVKNHYEFKDIPYLLNPLHNYTSLNIFLRTLLKKENEYLETSPKLESLKKELESIKNIKSSAEGISKLTATNVIKKLEIDIKNQKDLIDELNSSEIFSKENILKLYLFIQLLVDKEEAIISFINDLINGKNEYIVIEDNKVIFKTEITKEID